MSSLFVATAADSEHRYRSVAAQSVSVAVHFISLVNMLVADQLAPPRDPRILHTGALEDESNWDAFYTLQVR